MQDKEEIIGIIKSYEETFTQLENKYRTHPHYPGGEWYLLEKLENCWSVVKIGERNNRIGEYKGTEDKVLLYLLFLIIDEKGTITRISEKERFKETYGYRITDSQMTYTKLLEFMDELNIDKNAYSTEGRLIKNTFMIIMNGTDGAFYSVSGDNCVVEERRQFTKEGYSAFNSLLVVAHRKNELIKIENRLHAMGIDLSDYSKEIPELILPKSPYYSD